MNGTEPITTQVSATALQAYQYKVSCFTCELEKLQQKLNRQGQLRISIAEADERFMAEWWRDHPEEVATTRAFYQEKRWRHYMNSGLLQ
jgi:hypothetical protein